MQMQAKEKFTDEAEGRGVSTCTARLYKKYLSSSNPAGLLSHGY